MFANLLLLLLLLLLICFILVDFDVWGTVSLVSTFLEVAKLLIWLNNKTIENTVKRINIFLLSMLEFVRFHSFIGLHSFSLKLVQTE